MPMNIDGDFVTRFGARLPVPYMERIEVQNNQIDIQLSFYLKPPDDTDESYEFFEEYIKSLEDLTVSIVAVADGVKSTNSDTFTGYSTEYESESFYQKYGPIEISDVGDTKLFENLMHNNINILQIAQPTNILHDLNSDLASTDGYEDFTKYCVKNFDDFALVLPNGSTTLYSEKMSLASYQLQQIYTTQGELVNKYTRSITIAHDEDKVTTGDSAGPLNTMTNFINAISSGLKLNFVAFTTSLPEYPNDFTEEQKSSIINRTPQAHVLFSQVSDLSYEQVASENTVKSSEITVFKTLNDEFYNGNVLQSIDSAYYGNSQLTNESIIGSFSDLIGTTSDSDLQSKFDNLAFILQVHGKEHDILVKLNEFRKTFVETSTATAVGRFHETLEIRLYNANNAVKRGSQLQKVLNVSPVVVDARTSFYQDYVAPVYDTAYDIEKATNYIYNENSLLSSYALPAGYQFSTEEAQARADAFQEELNSASTAVEELENGLHTLYQEILNQIYNAFDAMGEIANSRNEGIPEKYRSSDRTTWGDYLSITQHVASNCQTDRLASVRISQRTAGTEGISMRLAVQRTEDAGDLDGDGIVTSLPEYIQIKPRIWPLDFSLYSEVFERKRILFTDYSEFTGMDPVYGDIDFDKIADVARLKTRRGVGSNPVADEHLYNPDDIVDNGKTQSSYDGPNYFYDMQRLISRGLMQSSKDTKIKIDNDEESARAAAAARGAAIGGSIAGAYGSFVGGALGWLVGGEDPPDTLKVDYRFDPGGNIQIAVHNFLETYEQYLQSLADLGQVEEQITMYSQLAALGGIAGVDLIYTKYNLYFNGFTFFDYEKALKRTSNISKIFDVSKVEQLFGKQLSHTYYKVTDAKLQKQFDRLQAEDRTDEDVEPTGGTYVAPRESDLIFDNPVVDIPPTVETVEFGASYYAVDPINMGYIYSFPYNGSNPELADVGVSPYTTDYQQMAIVLPNLQRSVHEGLEGISDIYGAQIGRSVEQTSFGQNSGPGSSGEVVESYFVPRSMEFASPDANDDYRLLCYEIKDVVGSFTVGDAGDGYGENTADGYSNMGGDYGSDYLFSQNPFGTSYVISINLEDATKDMYVMIAKTLTRAIEEYSVYYDAINEECSYDNSDERMNKFFIDGVLANYSSAPHLAPWYRAALVYHTHLDLLYNQYGGERESIIQAAINTSQKLHPENITLAQADSFNDLLLSLLNDTYMSSEWAGLIGEMDSLKRVEFGGLNATNGYAPVLKNLPKPVNVDYLGYSFKTGDVVAVDVDDLP